MPNEHVTFKPRAELLSFEEIVRFVELLVPCGVHKIRLTGGEPLLRSELPELVRRLANIPGIDDLALTTNGILLEEFAQPLRAAGLQRLNISLDTLREETFQRISRRTGLERVLAGIAAAQTAGFTNIRLNAVAIRGTTEVELVPLVRFANERGMNMRFIEFMPLDAQQQWQHEQVLTGDEILRTIEQELGTLLPIERDDPSQPAQDYRSVDGWGNVGIIRPVTQPFCSDCNRLRITAEGQLRNCLFSTHEWDVRQLLRSGASDAEILNLVRDCVWAKKPGHGIDSPTFLRPERAMYQIGG
jgi:cyclic pyranopterin phosphate synthase